jgi:hypothetical protein
LCFIFRFRRFHELGFTLKEGPCAARFSPHYPSIPFTSLSLSIPLSPSLSLSLSLSLSPSLPPSLSLLSLPPSLYLSFYLSFSLFLCLSLLFIILFGVSNGRFRPCFTLRPSDLITTLTYVHMYYFCPCFIYCIHIVFIF